eukprot:TRINITY_DN34901_c0_g1_i1.p1 TRINITY_DN34901_c0_g1~~TRINITY_DN34901_c0_g1_i1.p1  ORF type:complete len:397 (+),score=6.36 TRINITY_DN34901_c0_g1_i1:121-1191(+)
MSALAFATLRAFVDSSFPWKACFLSGLLSVPYLFWVSSEGYLGSYQIFDSNEQAVQGQSLAVFALGGLFVGLGTKLGNGCTSGHAVCGLARLSKRSFVAVAVFLSCGLGIATIRGHYPFLDQTQTMGGEEGTYYKVFRVICDILIGLIFLLYIAYAGKTFVKSKTKEEKFDPIISFSTGCLFGLGLVLSGMCRGKKILAFLTIKEGWDPTLMFVLAGAVGTNLFTFQYILRKVKKPLYAEKFGLPTNNKIEWYLFVGPALFGTGWGLSGFCPGPAMINLFLMTHMIVFIPCMAIGMYCTYYLIQQPIWKKAQPAPIQPVEIENGKGEKESNQVLNESSTKMERGVQYSSQITYGKV